MAVLRSENGAAWCGLHADHLVGRSSRCDLQLDESYVSAQHAEFRWSGVWEVKDLGSRNGTSLNGKLLDAGRYYRISKGMSISFGRVAQTWIFRNDSEPCVMAMPFEEGEPAFAVDDVVAIPSPEAPEAVIVRGLDGSWQLERPDGVITRVDHDETFVVGGSNWLFCNPKAAKPTSVLDGRLSLLDVRLNFSVSTDEEHVDVVADWPGARSELGSRTHNYILLTLARQRLADAAAGVPLTACGWMYQDDLIRGLAMTATQLNVDIFRIRQQFAKLDLGETAAIVERRPRTKQLRIGIANLVVTRV